MEERRFVVISIYMKLDDAAYKICRARIYIFMYLFINVAADGTLQRQFFSPEHQR